MDILGPIAVGILLVVAVLAVILGALSALVYVAEWFGRFLAAHNASHRTFNVLMWTLAVVFVTSTGVAFMLSEYDEQSVLANAVRFAVAAAASAMLVATMFYHLFYRLAEEEFLKQDTYVRTS